MAEIKLFQMVDCSVGTKNDEYFRSKESREVQVNSKKKKMTSTAMATNQTDETFVEAMYCAGSARNSKDLNPNCSLLGVARGVRCLRSIQGSHVCLRETNF